MCCVALRCLFDLACFFLPSAYLINMYVMYPANERVFLTSNAHVAPLVSGGSDASCKGGAGGSSDSLVLEGLAGRALERHTVTGASSPQM